jgi:hypothetical protein
MQRLFPLAFLLAGAAVVLAEDSITTPAEAFNAGKEFANEGKTAAGGSVNSTSGSNNLPYYSTSSPETGHFQSGRSLIGGAGTTKQANCQSYTAPSAFEQQECEAVNFLSRNSSTRIQYTIDAETDPLIVGSQEVIDNPGSVPGASEQECRVETVVTPGTYTTEYCTETYTLEETSCSRVLTVACDPESDGCDVGGIVPNSWNGDMATSFRAAGDGNYILQFGTIADNYWQGNRYNGAVYNRTLTFTIRDVDLISKFMLSRASFDDWLLVKVNGTVVWVGPYGGDRLKVVSYGFFKRVQYCANCYGKPELSTSWNKYPNIDLRPYLKNGSNTIFTRTVVAGGGESAIRITTRQLCPRNCYDQWDDSQCEALEARTQ